MPFKNGVVLILWLFVGLVRSSNVLSVWLQYPTINTATRVYMTFDVHSSTAYSECKFAHSRYQSDTCSELSVVVPLLSGNDLRLDDSFSLHGDGRPGHLRLQQPVAELPLLD